MARAPMFQPATVVRVIRETADSRTFVLAPAQGSLPYRAGQFCTFRVTVGGAELLRSYSMSSAPESDGELMLTVKRVPGGQVSNWLIDTVTEGDQVEITEARGVFCLRPTQAPLLGFSAGSGITPIMSLAKSALAGTTRRVRLLCADRNRASALFHEALADLAARHPDRLSVLRHYDDVHGLPDAATIRTFVGDDTDADYYLCGPEPFMDLVEAAVPGSGTVFVERFGAAPTTAPAAVELELDGTITIILGAREATVTQRAGETLLESARRGGLEPPSSCESGTCATCIALVADGKVSMRVNDALSEDEVDEGYVLTCQGIPETPFVTVRYE